MLQSFLDPAILFFVAGVAAGALKSNLEIPAPISRFLSLYLLMALGLKGGFALSRSGLTSEVALGLGCAVALALIVPALSYLLLRRMISGFDAAALAATYGSVSAVTFITAVQFLETHGIDYGGHMAAAMALMESPAIIIAVFLANHLRQRARAAAAGGPAGSATGVSHLADQPTFGRILHESLTDGAQVLLLAAMLIGMVTGAAGEQVMQPFSGDLFKGMLAFFLLDMGLLCARNVGGLRSKPPLLLLYAIVAPLLHAGLALMMAVLTGLRAGDGMLLMTLAASASYIAVPAVIRHAISEANPSLYFGMSLGITFPFNILVGIPLYAAAAHRVLS